MDPKLLNTLLTCDPDAGKLFWRARSRNAFATDRDMKKWNTRYAGREALTCVHPQGYRRGSINGKSVYAHRVIYVMIYGPLHGGMFVDHINGNRLDNSARNLRSVTHLQNCRNQNAVAASSTGARGVHFVKRDGTYQARIRVGGKTKSRAGFATVEAAAAGRKILEETHWET